MRFVELSPTTWNENCRTCQVANKRVIPEDGDVIVPRPEALLDYLTWADRPKPKVFDEWSLNPKVTGELWYCPVCETLWDVNTQLGYSVQCMWNGVFTQSDDVINMPNTPVEIPPKPSDYSTLCTCCNTWREITSEKIIYMGTSRMVARTHRCNKCHLADTITEEEPEIQEMRHQFTEVPRDLEMS